MAPVAYGHDCSCWHCSSMNSDSIVKGKGSFLTAPRVDLTNCGAACSPQQTLTIHSSRRYLWGIFYVPGPLIEPAVCSF